LFVDRFFENYTDIFYLPRAGEIIS